MSPPTRTDEKRLNPTADLFANRSIETLGHTQLARRTATRVIPFVLAALLATQVTAQASYLTESQERNIDPTVAIHFPTVELGGADRVNRTRALMCAPSSIDDRPPQTEACLAHSVRPRTDRLAMSKLASILGNSPGLLLLSLLPAQQKEAAKDAEEVAMKATKARAFVPAEAVQRGCDILLSMAEGQAQGEWPYEGVYRVREGRTAVIPIGYRVGGTAIVCTALIQAPGYDANTERQDAVARGVAFIVEGLAHPLMQPSTENAYDVRGWGHIYALQLFLELKARGLMPEPCAEGVDERLPWLIETLHTEAIPTVGGWNYANRRAGAPFMTGPALQALFAAAAAGHEVSEEVVGQALDSLERGRAQSGSVAYGSPAKARADTSEDDLRFMDKLPGSMGRMLATETTLMLAGRGDAKRLAAAVEAFFTHWGELDKRRKKQGTHEQPYGVAPYYFVYAHTFAARAIEMLPESARADARARLMQILADIEEPDGGWNDRVFARSRAFGTAMMMQAMTMPHAAPPATWPPTASKATEKK